MDTHYKLFTYLCGKYNLSRTDSSGSTPPCSDGLALLKLVLDLILQLGVDLDLSIVLNIIAIISKLHCDFENYYVTKSNDLFEYFFPAGAEVDVLVGVNLDALLQLLAGK